MIRRIMKVAMYHDDDIHTKFKHKCNKGDLKLNVRMNEWKQNRGFFIYLPYYETDLENYNCDNIALLSFSLLNQCVQWKSLIYTSG